MPNIEMLCHHIRAIVFCASMQTNPIFNCWLCSLKFHPYVSETDSGTVQIESGAAKLYELNRNASSEGISLTCASRL